MTRFVRPAGTHSGRPPAAVAGAAELAFLPLLFSVYVLAAVAPAPLAMNVLPGGCAASQLILAGLLFAAGIRMSLRTNPAAVATGVGLAVIGVVARLVGVVATAAVARAFRESGCPPVVSDTLTGLALVAAMPSANTSTAWTRRGGGNLALCVAIVVCTTLAAPAVVPAALRLAGVTDAANSGKFPDMAAGVIAWVVVPMGLGMLCGRLPRRILRSLPEPVGAMLSLGALLLLNYLNASRALPDLLARGTGQPLVLAAIGGLSLVSFLHSCGAAAGRFGGSQASRTAILHAVGMSNTALAATLAVEFFPDRPQILYPAMACTLFQHAIAVVLTIFRPGNAPPEDHCG